MRYADGWTNVWPAGQPANAVDGTAIAGWLDE
jgi:hypothetical protein